MQYSRRFYARLYNRPNVRTWNLPLTKKLKKLLRKCCGSSAYVVDGSGSPFIVFYTAKAERKFNNSFKWKELHRTAIASLHCGIATVHYE